MTTKPAGNEGENRRGKWRVIAAVLAALPAAFFVVVGGAWLFLVVRDRLLHSGSKSMLMRPFDTVLEPGLILLGGLACAACTLALARHGTASPFRKLALASVAILPSLLIGGYAFYWLVDRLLLKSLMLFPADVTLRAGALAVAALSTAATLRLAFARR